MTRDEIRTLTAGNLVEPGAHTVTHSRLSSLPSEAQRREIVESRDWLAETRGVPVASFSFPFGGPGDYTEETIRHLRGAGFERACTTAGGPAHRNSDPFRLPRAHVENWPGDRFESWLLRQLQG